MAIAHELGKFEGEVKQLLPHEIARWIAYFDIKADREKKAAEQARAKIKRRRR